MWCAKMAENIQDISMETSTSGGRPSSGTREEREARLKSFKDRQNDERQRKLEEMKVQALAAQRFKEQKEQERRQRLDDLRIKEDERRQLVEDRKRAINDAERDRLESIIKRNQEREARYESKRRNERSSVVFAFGSSTPRVLGPSNSSSSYWGHRRATSTQNITYSAPPLTRRQSERELDGSKKRATSAGGLEPEASTPQHPAGCSSGYVGRRRTDLMPTITTKDSLSTPPRKSFLRSPGPSRPSSSLSQQSTSSVASSVMLRSRPTATPRRPRPISIAITGVTNSIDPKKPESKPPLPKTRKSNLGRSQEKITKRKSITSPTESLPKSSEPHTPPPTNTVDDSSFTQIEITHHIENKDLANMIDKNVNDVGPLIKEEIVQNNDVEEAELIDIIQPPPVTIEENRDVEHYKIITQIQNTDITKEVENLSINNSNILDTTFSVELQSDIDQEQDFDMNASINLKPRITTEEEAKAALAERRRIAREEAEKQAEIERIRIEEEQRLEIDRQQKEEELQRQLIEQQRVAEEERLNEAIREVQRREEEEKMRKEEEQKLKELKEEAEKKAKEETEKQKAELQERLKNEEKEREARRKRVEAIMLRTRGKGSPGSASQTDERDSESKMNGSKSDVAENGHKSEQDLVSVDNIIPVESLKNANSVSTSALGTEDSLNSNSSWQKRSSQSDLMM